MQRDWCFAPHFLVRSAGFPLAWLDSLICDEASVKTDARLSIEEHCDDLALVIAERWTAHWPKPEGLRLKSFRKRLKNRDIFSSGELDAATTEAYLFKDMIDWNAALSAKEHAISCQKDAIALNLAHSRQALLERFDNALVREAVFLSSPSVYKNVLCSSLSAKSSRNARTRRTERQLMQYLQRLCAKNETTSFFGPINYGRLGAGNQTETAPAPALPTLPPVHMRVPALRKTFVANWAVQELKKVAEKIDQVRASCAPRIDFDCRLEDGSLFISSANRHIDLTRNLANLLAVMDGQRSLYQCATCLQITTDEALSLLAPLTRRGLVRIGIPLTATDPDPLTTLRKFLSALPQTPALQPILTAIEDIDTLRDAFSVADVQTKAKILSQCGDIFSQVSKVQDTRNGGAMYADRMILYEECRGDLGEIELDPAVSDALTQSLSPWFDVWTAIAARKRNAILPIGVDLWDTVFGPDLQKTPFSRFLKKVTAHPSYSMFQAQADKAEIDAQEVALADLKARIAQAGTAQSIEIPRSHLDHLIHQDDPITETGLFVSPDIMLASQPDGSITTILGEAHDTVMVWGWALGFHEANVDVTQRMWDYLAPKTSQNFANVVSAQRVKIVPFEYPGTSILMRAPSKERRNTQVAISDVMVYREPDGLRLRRRNGQELRLYNGELDTIVHRLFSLLKVIPPTIETNHRTPRLTCGNLVIQRQRWRLTRDAFGLQPAYDGNLTQLALDARRARRKWALPERVFMKSPDETKPILIDFRSLHSLEMLDAFFLADQAVVFTEMLPDGDALWLSDQDGERLTCELRCSFAAEPVTHLSEEI